jgi:hypothetical protein
MTTAYMATCDHCGAELELKYRDYLEECDCLEWLCGCLEVVTVPGQVVRDANPAFAEFCKRTKGIRPEGWIT